MWLTHSNSLFVCVVQVLFAKLLWTRNGSSPRMSQLWVKKSQVLEFSQKKMMIQIERVYPRESKKIIIWQKLWNWILVVFDQFFFFTFFKRDFFCISVFFDLPSECVWFWYWFLVNLICIYPIKTGFGAFFHGFAARAPTQTFGPVPGPKSISKCWYLKG